MNKIILMAVIATLSTNIATAKELSLLSVPILKEKLVKGTIIKDQHIGVKEINIARAANTIILNKADIIGLETTRNLRRGMPFYHGYVRVSPDIRNNDKVLIAYNVGGISLSTTGKALEDGNIGADINIMNSTSKKVLVGTIIAKNKVSVE